MTIYHADSRDHLDVLAGADVMVTDPPYGYSYRSSWTTGSWRSEPIANDDDTSARDLVLDAWCDKPALVFGSWKRPRPEGVRTVLIWDKETGPGMGDLALPWGNGWEEIYVLGGGYAGRRESGVVRSQRASPGSMVHPNEKPVSLMRALIEKCPPGIIVDPFMGSGSTLVACQQLGRKCIGFDVDERWCTLARDRVAHMPLFAA